MDTWLSPLPFWGYIEQGCYEHSCTSLSVDRRLSFWGLQLRGATDGSKVDLCLVLYETVRSLCKAVACYVSSPAVCEGSGLDAKWLAMYTAASSSRKPMDIHS